MYESYESIFSCSRCKVTAEIGTGQIPPHISLPLVATEAAACDKLRKTVP